MDFKGCVIISERSSYLGVKIPLGESVCDLPFPDNGFENVGIRVSQCESLSVCHNDRLQSTQNSSPGILRLVIKSAFFCNYHASEAS
jgi:hypothetical protein